MSSNLTFVKIILENLTLWELIRGTWVIRNIYEENWQLYFEK